jgi:hypothetical protein
MTRIRYISKPLSQQYLHYYEIVKYSSLLIGLLKIWNRSEIDHI